MIVLKHFIFRLSILVLQDIVNVSALRILCEELNNPKLQKNKDWNHEHHYWNFCMLDGNASKLGFMYDSQGGKKYFDKLLMCGLFSP